MKTMSFSNYNSLKRFPQFLNAIFTQFLGITAQSTTLDLDKKRVSVIRKTPFIVSNCHAQYKGKVIML